ncbi:hypothetical protein NC652_034550 [Populus alba x Populus x berolinensis]|nr:hypothetical protein NC652_034550 [Populus alba x Populus x berolinensis]
MTRQARTEFDNHSTLSFHPPLPQSLDCVWLVEKLHKMPWKHKLKVIHGMYSVPTRDRVSLLLPVGSGWQHFHFKWDFCPRK